MTTSQEPNRDENQYVLGAENATEMARIIDQDRLVTHHMGGLFPERQNTLVGIRDMLDIACGPGGWIHDVAFSYPSINVTGIDISRTMVEYATAYAKVRKLPNLRFLIMDALKPLDFPPESFDMVNTRFLIGFMGRDDWPRLIEGARRVLRPGGILRMTDSEGMGIINTPALGELAAKMLQGAFLARRSITPEGRSHGVTAVLEPLMRKAGFVETGSLSYAINFSAGTDLQESTCHNLMTALLLAKPFLTQQVKMLTPERFDELYQEAQREILSDDFTAIGYYLTAWGVK